ncbi:MAG: alanine racemase [Patescibacteria group bacterium]|nr:alanine racemase [Patescibacteria group bacterium]
MKLTPIIHPLVQDFLKHPDIVFQAKLLHNGPVHVIFPQIMDQTITRLKEVFSTQRIDAAIYYAHKPNKSIAFAKQALKNGIGIDVASRQELISALAAGFVGAQISCTGAKNREFLYLAVQHGCLISLDSQSELKEAALLAETLRKDVRVLIRIANPTSKDRNLKGKRSRFGVPKEELPEMYATLKTSRLKLCGFHYHNDERAADVKAGYTEDLMTIMEQAYAEGFSPTIINIGGGLRSPQLAHFEEWSAFLDKLEYALLTHKPTGTWRNYGFGMVINEKQKISGREKIQGKYTNQDFTEVLTELLENTSLRGRKLADIIGESMFTVMVEPGFALLQHCGISLSSVVGVKHASDGENYMLLDSNIYNHSSQMNELLTDPILFSRKQSGAPFSGYAMGNLCREEDIILKRKVSLSTTPQPGDVLCFINTAAYSSDFEDAQPHQHPTGKKFVAVQQDGSWQLLSEDVYNPFIH